MTFMFRKRFHPFSVNYCVRLITCNYANKILLIVTISTQNLGNRFVRSTCTR